MSSNIETLKTYIRNHGPIPTVRTSCAQARGAAKAYNYWGAARGEIRVAKAGHITCVSTERAGSDRRSERLADSDASAIAYDEGRVVWHRIGRLSEQDAEELLAYLATPHAPKVAS